MFSLLVTRLEDRLRITEAERLAAGRQLTDVKCQLQKAKAECSELKASNESRVDREEHLRSVAELSR